MLHFDPSQCTGPGTDPCYVVGGEKAIDACVNDDHYPVFPVCIICVGYVSLKSLNVV